MIDRTKGIGQFNRNIFRRTAGRVLGEKTAKWRSVGAQIASERVGGLTRARLAFRNRRPTHSQVFSLLRPNFEGPACATLSHFNGLAARGCAP